MAPGSSLDSRGAHSPASSAMSSPLPLPNKSAKAARLKKLSAKKETARRLGAGRGGGRRRSPDGTSSKISHIPLAKEMPHPADLLGRGILTHYERSWRRLGAISRNRRDILVSPTYSSSTERMVSRIEYRGFQPTSFTHREPSTAQRNWMWSSSGGGKLARRYLNKTSSSGRASRCGKGIGARPSSRQIALKGTSPGPTTL